jgi:crotonobetainyl-CoA:carnitine CoA-transferase CaiB-like acyl-CoA transferase
MADGGYDLCRQPDLSDGAPNCAAEGALKEPRRPLQGITICELLDGPLAPATRYLAELGAQVIHFTSEEVPALDTADRLAAFARNQGKEWRIVDPDKPEDRAATELAMGQAQAIVIDHSHGIGALGHWTAADLRARFPQALLVDAGDFGTGNSFEVWQATTPVLLAMSGSLSRSGIRGKPPLLPPGELAFESSALQLAWCILLGVYSDLQRGTGQALYFSALDGAMQALDPGYGISGSATMGKPAKELAPSRPPRGYLYPILPCADGSVRICLLASRQWRGMFEWMGSPAEFAAPEFNNTGYRYKSPTLVPAIGAFFAGQTRAELEAGAKQFGVPLSGLFGADESLEAEHFRTRNAFAQVRGPGGAKVSLPNGILEIDGERMTSAIASAKAAVPEVAPAADPALPLSGLKVIDLGVIVVGGEQGRLLADAGADVIKIESRAFPDGSRQSYLPIAFSVSFAAGHRNKRSLGLNLRDPEGMALFERLVAQADVVLTNFKPGTLESLGVAYDRLEQINPGIIVVESSAFGKTGPWAKRMGYGPLVRAATGLTSAWRYPGDPDGYSDSVTIYPDHAGGRVSAIGTLALLIDRLRSGRGGLATSSQAEVVFAHQAWQIAAAQAGLSDPLAFPDAPWGVFPAAGEDQWVVVTVRGDADWQTLCGVVPGLNAAMDRPARLAARESIETVVRAWTAARSPGDAASLLQAAGVPAGPMLRVSELPEHSYFTQRGTFREVRHAALQDPYFTEAMHARFESISPPPEKPAPLMGEHSSAVMHDWLGLDDAQIADLIARSVLEPLDDATITKLAELQQEWGNRA